MYKLIAAGNMAVKRRRLFIVVHSPVRVLEVYVPICMNNLWMNEWIIGLNDEYEMMDTFTAFVG